MNEKIASTVASGRGLTKKENGQDEANNNLLTCTVQAACPCCLCKYFHAVRIENGTLRKFCRLTGDPVHDAGAPCCEIGMGGAA